MEKPKWSFSALKQYINCPQNYYRARVTQEFKTNDTTYTIYGKEVHKVIENFLLRNTPIPAHYRDVLQHVPAIAALLPSRRYVEHGMALTLEGLPCAFDGPDYWVRGIADLLALDDTSAWIIDWKTGSPRYADTKQLKLMALLTFAHFPTVNRVNSLLYFTKDNSQVYAPEFTRYDIDDLWKQFFPDLALLEMSFAYNNWPMKPSGLCKFCPVSSCAHHRS